VRDKIAQQNRLIWAINVIMVVRCLPAWAMHMFIQAVGSNRGEAGTQEEGLTLPRESQGVNQRLCLHKNCDALFPCSPHHTNELHG